VDQISRPSLSYWQDAWRRFKKNKQGLASLMLVAGLTFFVIAGPSIYGVDSDLQDLTRGSVPPTTGDKAIVVPVGEAWAGVNAPVTAPTVDKENLAAPQNLRSVGFISTQYVRLVWDPVEGANSYAVYRNEVPSRSGELGVPIGETSSPEQVSFEDNATLEVKTYYYSVVAKNLSGVESEKFATLEAQVVPGLDLEQAQAIKVDAVVGDSVQLSAAPFGTDQLGRDMLARIMSGGRISLFIGVFAAILETLFGVAVGGLSGYFGGRLDNVIMRVTDFILGLPFLLFMILFKVVLSTGPGDTGVGPLIIALIVLSWPGPARLVRGQILSLKESEFIHASRLMGARPIYLLIRHLIPNLLGVILVSLTFAIPTAIFTEAFLSFVGLGVAAPATSWGTMSNDAIATILIRPHEFFFPAIFISITVLAFNLLGDGLRDALDPKLRSNE
jgi:oligopeptide transport system permease protein